MLGGAKRFDSEKGFQFRKGGHPDQNSVRIGKDKGFYVRFGEWNYLPSRAFTGMLVSGKYSRGTVCRLYT
uniref:Uncharacterized protein n=1 Tax=Leptospira ellisii TaxID=2023197 RepID=A0A2N0BCW1_9LEPT|nr:hypothetical protein CH379_02960 [Leptospira ellisii]